jgi:O-antigen/teichoic acid export membrane protein
VALENVLLNLLLIPFLSLVGAAAGTSFSTALVAVVIVTVAQRTVGRVDWRRVLLSTGLGSIASGVAMLVLKDSLPVAIAVGAIVYVAVFVLVERVVFRTELDYFLDLTRGSAVEN